MKSLKYDVKHEVSPMVQQLRDAYISPEHDLQTKFEYYQDYLEHTIELYAEVLSRKQEENEELRRQLKSDIAKKLELRTDDFLLKQENEELRGFFEWVKYHTTNDLKNAILLALDNYKTEQALKQKKDIRSDSRFR
jgi:cell shape-determining protein MreC